MTLTTAEQELESYLDTLRSSTTRGGKPLSPGTVVGYVNKFKQIYTDLEDNIFDPYELECWVSDPERNYKPSTVVQYADVICKVAGEHAPESIEDLKAMRDMYVAMKNDPENEARQWVVKDALLAQFEHIPYADMLEMVVRQTEEELVTHTRVATEEAKRTAKVVPHQTRDARLRIILICVLLGANAPMRSDYRNIVIASRVNPIPPKTPYYEDGWIYTPPGSRLKDSDGAKDSLEKIDVTAAQDIIETLIFYHDSELLFGIPYDSSTFSRLLRTQTTRIFGVGLGIRFFRTKFSVEDDKVDAAHTVLAIMGHDIRTHRAAYSGTSRTRAVLEPVESASSNEGNVVENNLHDPFIEEVAAGFGGCSAEGGIEVDDEESQDEESGGADGIEEDEESDVDEGDVEDNPNAKRQKIETVPITLRLA